MRWLSLFCLLLLLVLHLCVGKEKLECYNCKGCKEDWGQVLAEKFVETKSDCGFCVKTAQLVRFAVVSVDRQCSKICPTIAKDLDTEGDGIAHYCCKTMLCNSATQSSAPGFSLLLLFSFFLFIN
ncbi:hypothetical protein Ciccas_008055 [Cichlidogyrus casuarinus]|uniref:Snake toxin/toxin-like domain-containing protein n=1 Tax=Cichlidogyrus casuarinus TaxID=1844966 RepID=A0ABD2Q161_9PLAT